MEMIPLFKPYMPAELPELISILQSGALTYGKWGKLFEQKLGEYIGDSRVLSTNSYNSAMLIALAVIGTKPGDEIIASPMSCLASNQPFATQYLKVVWADIDPKTGTLNPEDVKSKITSKTKAIFHNHYCGYIGYIDEINQIAKENGISVVDDAIEAFGSEYKGKRMGNTGADMTVFSFQTVRLPNTIEGGAIAFNNNDFYKRAKIIRDYGIERSNFRDELGEINPKCDIIVPGFGATLSDVNSYIGCIQMGQIEELLRLQRSNASNYTLHWTGMEGIQSLKPLENTLPNYWVYGLFVSDKHGMMKRLRKNGLYASGVHLNNNVYTVFGVQPQLKGVDAFSRRFLALPSGWWILEGNLLRMNN
jgi:dTDP-4-amino-4,6-dideoxygalactose transaminase